MIRTLGAALLLTTALVSPAALAEPRYPATVDVFGSVSNDGPGGGLELVAPFSQSEGSLLFGLARGVMGDETGTGGIGLGYRTQALPGFILGGYGMVDYHHGASNEGYFQGVLGLEALTESFDLRINGYLPEDDENLISEVTGAAPPPPPVTVGEIVITGHEIGLVSGTTAGTGDIFRLFEQPLPGVDAEIGYRLPVPGHDFRIFLGAFHFEGGNNYENVTGPKARAEWRIHDLDLFGNNSRLTLEAGIRDDDVRGTDASAGLRLRIPFGGVPSNQRGHELAGLDQRMLDPIRREDHIVMGERDEMQAGTPSTVAIEAVKAVETGNEITSIWFADGAGGGDGTMGNETDLAGAVTGAGTGGLIVALGGSGDLIGNVTLADNQILLGGASNLQIMGLTSGNMATYAPGGARPTIIDDSLAPAPVSVSRVAALVPVVTLADGNLIAGVDALGRNDGNLVDFNDAAFSGTGVDNLIMRDVDVRQAGVGLLIDGGSNVRVTDFSHVTDAADPILAQSTIGIISDGANGSSYDQLYFERLFFGGLIGNATGVDITNVTALNVGAALDIQSNDDVDVDMVNVTYNIPILPGRNASGLVVRKSGAANPNPSNHRITNITVTGAAPSTALQAVRLFDSTNITIDNVTATNVNAGLDIARVDGLTATDTTVTNSLNNGIKIQDSTNVDINGFTVTGGQSTGVQVLGVGSAGKVVTVRNGAISNLGGAAGFAGIHVVNAVGDNAGGKTGVTFSNIAITGQVGTPATARTGVFVTGSNGINFQQISVDGRNAGGTAVTALGFVFNASSNINAQNISAANITGAGIQSARVASLTVNNFTVQNAGGPGIVVNQNSTANSFSNGTISNTGLTSAFGNGGGIQVVGFTGGATSASFNNITITGARAPVAAQAAGVEVTAAGPTTTSFNGVTVTASGTTMVGFRLTGAAGSVSGLGNMSDAPTDCAITGTTGTIQIDGVTHSDASC